MGFLFLCSVLPFLLIVVMTFLQLFVDSLRLQNKQYAILSTSALSSLFHCALILILVSFGINNKSEKIERRHHRESYEGADYEDNGDEGNEDGGKIKSKNINRDKSRNVKNEREENEASETSETSETNKSVEAESEAGTDTNESTNTITNIENEKQNNKRTRSQDKIIEDNIKVTGGSKTTFYTTLPPPF